MLNELFKPLRAWRDQKRHARRIRIAQQACAEYDRCSAMRSARQMREHIAMYEREWDLARKRGYESDAQRQQDELFYQEKIGLAREALEFYEQEARK